MRITRYDIYRAARTVALSVADAVKNEINSADVMTAGQVESMEDRQRRSTEMLAELIDILRAKNLLDDKEVLELLGPGWETPRDAS